MSKTFLEALTSVGKNLQSGVDKLKENKANVVSLEQYCGSEDAGYQFFLKCNSMMSNTEKQIWEIPQNKTLHLKHYVTIPPNITIRGGTILIDNVALDTYQAIYGGMICIFKNNITFENVAITVNNANQGMTLFVFNSVNNFTMRNCRIELNGSVSYQAMLYLFSKNKNIRFIDTDIISNSPGVNGSPILISNQTTDTVDCESKNIVFNNCYIESNSGDEMIAVMSQVNILENVSFNNCIVIRQPGSEAKFIFTIFSHNQTTYDTVNTIVKNCAINNCTIMDYAESTTNPQIIRLGFASQTDDLKNIRIKNCQIYANLSTGQQAITVEPVNAGGCIKIDGCYIENTADTKGYAFMINDTSGSVEITNCDVTNLIMYSNSNNSRNKNNKLDGIVQDYFGIYKESVGEDGYVQLENGLTFQWLKHKSITVVSGETQTFYLPTTYKNFYGAYFSTNNSSSSANISISNSGIQEISVTNFGDASVKIDILCITA